MDLKIYSGVSPAKMLRVSPPSAGLPSHEHRIRSPLREREENNLRSHIVGMVREQSGEINLSNMKTGESTVIYQIKKKGGIVPLTTTDTAEDNRNNTMKRIHMKMMRATRAKGLRQFPALDTYADIINNENQHDMMPTSANEPSKRIRTVNLNDNRRGSSAKNVRFKIEDKSTHVPLSPFPGYELRGNAIKSGSMYNKSAPAATKRSEAQQRQSHIHTSLQLFKRRLKLNQDSYLAPNSTVRESDYVIRRVPFKLENNSKNNLSQTAPLEPRLNVTSKFPPRPKTPNTRPVTPSNARSKVVRPVSSGNKSQNSENQERKIKFSYRLPDNLSLGKEVSFVEESEPIPNVNTYVLEENKRRGTKKFETQATLSTHNLGVHDALTANDGSKIQVGEEGEVDHRLFRWVTESNVNNHSRKMNRLRSSTSRDSDDHNPLKLADTERSISVI